MSMRDNTSALTTTSSSSASSLLLRVLSNKCILSSLLILLILLISTSDEDAKQKVLRTRKQNNSRNNNASITSRNNNTTITSSNRKRRKARRINRIKQQNLKNQKLNVRNNIIRREEQATPAISSYTVTTTTYKNENCEGINCDSPIIIIGPVNIVTKPPPIETTTPTQSPTPSPINRLRKIYTEVSIIFGNNAALMTNDEIVTFQDSMLEYWKYYIDTEKMFMDEVTVNYQLSLTAKEYLKEANSGNRRKLLNYDDYDYGGLDRAATGFNISTSLYVDPYCYGCPDPQTLQIDSINPLGMSLFGRALSHDATDASPMHVKRIPLSEEQKQQQKRLPERRTAGTMTVNVNFDDDSSPSRQSASTNTNKYSTSSQTSSTLSQTSSTSSQTSSTSSFTTSSKTSTEIRQSSSQNNIFDVFQVTNIETTPELNIKKDGIDIVVISNETTTTTTTKSEPKDGLVYFLRSTMPSYFNQVDDAMAFSHSDVSLFDSLVCYINFSIVVQEVGENYFFLTCDQYLVHQCFTIEEQCYPEGEVPCVG